ncbi:MAG: hypothetical protein ABI432_11805 [Flavobacteriales bacterium]
MQEPGKYANYKYSLDETFLDLVLRNMFQTRGTYHTVDGIRQGLEHDTGTKIRHNDLVMALEKLAKDEYLTYEGEREPGHDVYRLTYDGYIAVKSSQSSSPYEDFIKRNRKTKNSTRSTKIFLTMNAVALVVITSLQAWSQFTSDADAMTIARLESANRDGMEELNKAKETNSELRLRLAALKTAMGETSAKSQEH